MRASTTAPDVGNRAALPVVTSGTERETAHAFLDWLVAQWSSPRTREVMIVAAPSFAAQVEAIVSARSCPIGPREADRIRRAAVSLYAYLARWQRRATPFGLFAGVTSVQDGPAADSVFGDAHRAHVRADSTWLACVIDELEADPELRRRLSVVFDNTTRVRDGRLHIVTPTHGQFRGMNAATQGDGADAWGWRETSLRFNKLIDYVARLTRTPVTMSRLLDQLDAALPTVERGRLNTVLDQLLNAGALVTCLRPPTTVDDPLRHVCTELDRAGAADLTGVSEAFKRLCEIHEDLTRYAIARDRSADASLAGEHLEAAQCAMAQISDDRQPLAYDTELDASVRLPRSVLAEAKQAAETLLRLTTEPFGSPAWVEYHLRFRERYGPGALVPVQDLVSDAGLGYPTGYLGSPSTTPVWRTVTDRDAYLAARIQETILAGQSELCLTDRDLEKLTIGDPETVTPPARIELGFALAADTEQDVDAGRFRLQVTGTPASATSMMGRFTALLPNGERRAVAATFADEPLGDRSDVNGSVVHAQLSFPSRQASGGNVTRVGQMLPAVIHLGEHPEPQGTGQEVILLDDLAVTGDAERLWLVQVTTGRVVVARVPHALELTTHAPVLARLLAEVSESRSAVFRPLDPGAAARTLPYLPRITHRRTVFSPARWRVSNSDFDAGGQGRDCDDWDTALHRWRDRWKVPVRVVMCSGDLRLPIDLTNPGDQLLFRRQLGRTPEMVLQEHLAPDGGWLGRPTEFLAAFTAQHPKVEPSRQPQTPTLQRSPATRHPGTSDVLVAHLPCNPAHAEELLITVGGLLDHLVQANQSPAGNTSRGSILGWWGRRDHDPLNPASTHRISLFLKLSAPEAYGDAAAAFGGMGTELAARNLPHLFTLVSYAPHQPRYGGATVFPLAEAVFVADTAAALAQVRFAHRSTDPSTCDERALTAASMATIAAALAPDPTTGHRWLAEGLRGHTMPVDHAVTAAARRIAAPDETAHPSRDSAAAEVTKTWAARHMALTNYRGALISAAPATHDPAQYVLRSLLHEHVRRTLGTDRDLERQANHAARSVALSLLAQRSRP
nr:lantibiotic dehydratase [Nocardioides sp. KC13]